MRLSITKSAHSTAYTVIKSAYKNGKRTSVVVEKLGNGEDIKKRAGSDVDPETWARQYVEKLNEDAKLEQPFSISFNPQKDIADNKQRLYNGGYLALQQIYYELGIDKICRKISSNREFDFDLNSILSRLVYSRILYPASKRATCELSQKFIEQHSFDEHQVYRALSVLHDSEDLIQSSIYKNSLKISSRNTQVLYYDCTNFFFEIEEAAGIKQYGVSKEHRPNPIVQMGLFMDGDGIPLSFCINPGNTNEQTTLKPLEEKILSDFNLSKFIVCTDAGLSSLDNRIFNTLGDRAFITVQSVKTLKKFIKDWALDDSGWTLPKSNETFNISELDEAKDVDKIFYKERWIKENGLEQRLIVSYSLKYKNYLRNIREQHISRAKKLVDNPKELNHKKQTDYKRLVKETKCTSDGEIADKKVLTLDNEKIAEEEQYDGFYAVCTNLEDDISEILLANKRRWEIEECFMIMKHEFKARPAYLQRDDRISAHFMTCYLALIIYRYLEKKLENKYSVEAIVTALRDMNYLKLDGYGYIPTFTKNAITDAIENVSGLTLQKEIIPIQKMKNICHLSKTPNKSK